jgi:broad specificity polyphosphatase/5'/3'-nucleotidase SurE
MFQRGEIEFADGTDLAALANLMISVTPLRLDLTDEESRLRFEKAFAAT